MTSPQKPPRDLKLLRKFIVWKLFNNDLEVTLEVKFPRFLRPSPVVNYVSLKHPRAGKTHPLNLAPCQGYL